MALIKNPLSGGGSGGSLNIINGIIEQYKAESGTISANTFVEFVDLLNKGETRLTVEGSSYNLFNAVPLEDDKVLVIWKYASNSIYGTVLTIADGTIDNGAAYALTSSSYSGQVISAVKLSNNKVFIAHSSGTSSSDLILYGMVCTISGTTVTAGTDTRIGSNNNGNYITATALSDSSVFVGWIGNYGVACTISGTNLTVGTSVRLSSKSDSDYRQSIALSSDKVLIMHRARESNYDGYDFYDSVCYIVCSIVGNVTTVESDEELVSLYGGDTFTLTALGAETLFVVYVPGGADPYLRGLVCSISGNMLDIVDDTELSGYCYGGAYSHLAITTTSSGYAFLVWGQNMSGDSRWPMGMYPRAYEYSPVVKIATNRNSVRGITSTACTDTTPGDVWVLNTSESE